jgi:hypothetical protein
MNRDTFLFRRSVIWLAVLAAGARDSPMLSMAGVRCVNTSTFDALA